MKVHGPEEEKERSAEGKKMVQTPLCAVSGVAQTLALEHAWPCAGDTDRKL